MVIIRQHFTKEFLFPVLNEPKQLPKEFYGIGEVRGFTFLQLKLQNNVALYRVSDTFGNIVYETFKVKLNSLYNGFYYPRSKAFGVTAWCCKSWSKAEQRFNSLVGEEIAKDLSNGISARINCLPTLSNDLREIFTNE